MKKLFGFLLILFILIACRKDDDRVYGVCYCEFANGKKQEYDLTHLSREKQIEQTSVHNTNAAKFGGHCVLE